MRRNAFLFVLISLLSGLGSTAMTLAAGIWVLDLSGSVPLAALAGLCIYVPTFAAPWLGALVDRLPRRPLLIGVDVVLGLLILALLLVRSPGAVGLIYAVLLARGLSYVLLDAGESAILPSALPASLLGDVNGWRSSAQEGTKIVAPLLGAGLYAWRGPTPVVLICAALPLLTAACYAALRLPPAPAPARTEAAALTTRTGRAPVDQPGPSEVRTGSRTEGSRLSEVGRGSRTDRSGATEVGRRSRTDRSGATEVGRGSHAEGSERGEVRAGLRRLFGNPAVRGPVLVAAAAIGLSGMANAAVIAQVVHGLHLPATRLGILSTAQGVGSIVSGLLVGRLLARRAPIAVAKLGTAVFGVACVSSSIAWWPAVIAGSALAGLGLVLTLIAAVTAVQTRTPGHLLGRVSATSNTVMFGPIVVAIPLGSALVHFGPTPLFLITAALAAAAACYRPHTTAVQPTAV